jgi:serine/threonine protein kinase
LEKEAKSLSNQQLSLMLEHYVLGEPHYVRSGTLCYPATEKDTGESYIAKVRSFPSSSTITDAFLLTGTFKDTSEADAYYKEEAREQCRQAAILNALSHSEYFSHITFCQSTPRADIGYDVWFLSPFRLTLAAILEKRHLPCETVLELGINLCRGMIQCRETGFLYTGIKPENIYLSNKGTFQIGDTGFVSLSSLPYAPLPDGYTSPYAPPECRDPYSRISQNADVYGIGAVLFQAFNGGKLPNKLENPPIYAGKDIATIIMKACAISPEKRYLDPEEMLMELQSCKEIPKKE